MPFGALVIYKTTKRQQAKRTRRVQSPDIPRAGRGAGERRGGGAGRAGLDGTPTGRFAR